MWFKICRLYILYFAVVYMHFYLNYISETEISTNLFLIKFLPSYGVKIVFGLNVGYICFV